MACDNMGIKKMTDENRTCGTCGWWVPDDPGIGWCDRIDTMTRDNHACQNWETGRENTEDDGYPD